MDDDVTHEHEPFETAGLVFALISSFKTISFTTRVKFVHCLDMKEQQIFREVFHILRTWVVLSMLFLLVFEVSLSLWMTQFSSPFLLQKLEESSLFQVWSPFFFFEVFLVWKESVSAVSRFHRRCLWLIMMKKEVWSSAGHCALFLSHSFLTDSSLKLHLKLKNEKRSTNASSKKWHMPSWTGTLRFLSLLERFCSSFCGSQVTSFEEKAFLCSQLLLWWYSFSVKDKAKGRSNEESYEKIAKEEWQTRETFLMISKKKKVSG